MYIDLDKNSAIPISRQLQDWLRQAILDGTLAAETKMPSTRALAKELAISRNTLVESYEQLMAEGYLYGVEGSGTYVCSGIRFNVTPSFKAGRQEEEEGLFDQPAGFISFRAGVPDLPTIPIEKWGRLYREVTASVDTKQLDYHNVFGAWTLRKTLAEYLRRVRGVEAKPSNILITGGAAQAFSLLCSLVPHGGFAVVEDPASTGLIQTLNTQGVHCHPVPVDESGLCSDELPDYSPSLIFTTPSHQFPTGVIMSARRRIDLIRYAMDKEAYIVEDDYDSEFRYEGSPIRSMQSLAPSQVIYVGTFSKTLMPAIRMGYMVLPDSLIDVMEKEKYASDLHSPILEQLTLARFIEDGLMDRHIGRMKKLYRRRRELLVGELKSAFGETVSISGDGAGLHLIVAFRALVPGDEVIEKLEENKLQITMVSDHCLDTGDRYSRQFIIGFGNTNETMIVEGIERLRRALRGKL